MAIIYGTTGGDQKTGTTGNDTIYGWAKGGNANSTSGNDTLNGGGGNDQLEGGTGSDNLLGGAGIDTLYGHSGSDTLRGGDSNDSLFGQEGSDSLFGDVGNDRLVGEAGNDILNGGLGIDTLIGGTGYDTYLVDSTTDTIIEVADSGRTQDTVLSSVSYTLGANLEILDLSSSSSDISGTGNLLDNYIYGNSGNNSLYGGDGTDYLFGGWGGYDYLSGGTGNDNLDASESFTSVLEGGTGNDTYTISGNPVSDNILEYVDGGVDTVDLSNASLSNPFEGSYTLSSNLENLIYEGIPTSLNGNTLDNDILVGVPITYIALGGNAGFTIDGGSGNDTLSGSLFSDTLTGSAGTDNFRFSNRGEGIDTITDFSVVDDTISVATYSFDSGLTAGAALTAAQFVLGTAAVDASNRFIYNKNTGGLFFDSDGNGTTGQVQFASLSPGLAMTNADIFVI